MTIIERMRRDWDQRAREDAYFYAGFNRRKQSDADFFSSAPDTILTIEAELARLPPSTSLRGLEIGCGPGRLMGSMSRHFSEIHGVDISAEMVDLARQNLKDIPNAQVHVTPDSSLASFDANSCDFVYSYLVFQHIPDRAVVLHYLEEARRVLKPGGILCAQLRGTPPMDTELEREPETWTGCHFSANEMMEFARIHAFPLVAIWGLETQYMWTVWRKPSNQSPLDFSRATVKDVTVSSAAGRQVPQRGRDACISLWIDGLPENASLSDLEITIGESVINGCYLSPVGPTGGAQLNARLPSGVPLGTVPVALFGVTHHIDIVPIDLPPTIVDVTDAIHIGSKYRIETGGMKVTLEGIEKPGEVSFHLKGREAEIVQIEFKDPVTLKYEFSFYLPQRTPRGQLTMIIRISGREIPVPIEIV
jgi:SAM-dependent methyltransferase